MQKTLHKILKLHSAYGYKGEYSSWDKALTHTTGYDADSILKQVSDATQKVIANEATFERDGISFEIIEYAWPLVAVILMITHKDEKLNIIDFGGSLGSTYFQHRNIFNTIFNKVKWSIVEQGHYVEYGNKKILDKNLGFYDNLVTCVKKTKSKTLLLSGSLGYIENIEVLVSNILKLDFDFIIIDRTVFVEGCDDMICIQIVPPSIYRASYPIRLFNYSKLVSRFSSKYEVALIFPPYHFESGTIKGNHYQSKGILLVKKGINKKYVSIQ